MSGIGGALQGWDCFKECVSQVLPSAGWVELALIVGALVAVVASGGTLTVPLIIGIGIAGVSGGTAGVLLTCLGKCVL